MTKKVRISSDWSYAERMAVLAAMHEHIQSIAYRMQMISEADESEAGSADLVRLRALFSDYLSG